ncbi:MAG: hypothetical protein ACRERC_25590 [Candidatus Binatia bacterium]
MSSHTSAIPHTRFLLERVRGGLWLAVLATAFFTVAPLAGL